MGGRTRTNELTSHWRFEFPLRLLAQTTVSSLALRDRATRKPALFLDPVSRTFDRKDIFAPVSARLVAGEPFRNVGSKSRILSNCHGLRQDSTAVNVLVLMFPPVRVEKHLNG